VLGGAIVGVVRSGLKPLERVAIEVQQRDAHSLAPIGAARLPEEVAPLVQELNRLLERLNAAFQRQRAFIADAAHELRSPLTAVRLDLQLLDRAPDEAARLAKSRGRIAVICGPGGNGGDGFVAARLLERRGYAVELGLMGRRDALSGDPALAAARYEGAALSAAAVDPGGADCVIDALFGAGLARDIEGEAKAIIERINAFARGGGRVLAVDIPSGVDGASGKARGVAVEASASVTFFRLKPGHLLLPGRALCGTIRLADIGIPASVLPEIAPKTFVNSPVLWLHALPRIGPESHKYTRGAALVLSGPAHLLKRLPCPTDLLHTGRIQTTGENSSLPTAPLPYLDLRA